MSRRELANAIRALSMDAVQKANSGHPGAPMGMADIAEVLWNDFLKHNPENPQWYDRDRFILSNGHASMLLYSLLHLTGYDLPIEEIKNFRQLHSKTPGHPEIGYTPGVETTTGPLGQGLANAVGLAIAERTLAAQFNQPDHEIVDHFTSVFFDQGDGSLDRVFIEFIEHVIFSAYQPPVFDTTLRLDVRYVLDTYCNSHAFSVPHFEANLVVAYVTSTRGVSAPREEMRAQSRH